MKLEELKEEYERIAYPLVHSELIGDEKALERIWKYFAQHYKAQTEEFEERIRKEKIKATKKVWYIIDQYPRCEIKYEDGSKSLVILEHSLGQAKQVSLEKLTLTNSKEEK